MEAGKREVVHRIRVVHGEKISNIIDHDSFHKLMLSILIFLQLFFTVLQIAINAGKKPTARLNTGNNEKPSEIQTPDQMELNSKKYALSTREVEILLLIREGLPYRLIGDKLHISQRTVSSHVANMFEKVSVTNKMELVNRVFIRQEFSCKSDCLFGIKGMENADFR